MAEVLGRGGQMASESVNCSAPDTGNMGERRCHIASHRTCILTRPEVLARYGSPEQQKKWLLPLLNGETRSAFSMTERFGTSYASTIGRVACPTRYTVASSDATNIRTTIRQEGNEIVVNGHKWYVATVVQIVGAAAPLAGTSVAPETRAAPYTWCSARAIQTTQTAISSRAS